MSLAADRNRDEWLNQHLDENDDSNDAKSEDSEEVIDQIQDNIEDVESVKDIGDDRFIVSIP